MEYEYYDVLFVSEERMKKYTSLDENIRVEDITTHILNAQAIYIQPILGTKLYNKIKNGIKEETLTPDEEELLQEYIAKTLMHYSLYLMLPFIKYRIVAKGVLNGASEETESTNLDELQYLRQSIKDTAEFYAQRLVEYLIDYSTNFPEYISAGTKGMLPDKNTPYFSGLVTNTKNKRCDFLSGESDYTIQNN